MQTSKKKLPKCCLFKLGISIAAFISLSYPLLAVFHPYPYFQSQGYAVGFALDSGKIVWRKKIASQELRLAMQVGQPLFMVSGHVYRFASLPSHGKNGIFLEEDDGNLLKSVVEYYEKQIQENSLADVSQNETLPDRDGDGRLVPQATLAKQKTQNKGIQEKENHTQSDKVIKTKQEVEKTVANTPDNRLTAGNDLYSESMTGRVQSENQSLWKQMNDDWAKRTPTEVLNLPLQRFDKSIKLVILDPGHGGRDPGAKAYGYEEKDLNLSLASAIRSQLKKINPKLEILMTRVDDSFLSLEERVNMANMAAADKNALFISVHHNIWFSASVRGLEMYHLFHDPLWFRSQQSSLAAMGGDHFHTSWVNTAGHGEFFRDLKKIFSLMRTVQYQKESKLLAETMLESLKQNIKNYRFARGVKGEIFFVLKGVLMPSVLLEGGFLSNPEDLKFLTNPLGRTELATHLALGINRYINQFSQTEGFTTVPLFQF